jgi:monofunctional biosynthetic peptidoglycan transglycosylase
MKKKTQPILLNSIKFIIALPVAFTVFTSLIILIFRFINPPVTAFMFIKSDISFENLFYNYEQSQKWVSLENISKNLTLAVIASEDQKFLYHFGFDIEQIEKAYDDMERGRRVRGASTISQQVVKNLFLSGSKNFIRKGIEAELTLLIELLWSKKRIIEVYLNIAEFGRDVFGAEAASIKFYKKSAKNLNKSEAAMLAAVLPNPIRYSATKPSGWLINRRDRILKFMGQVGGNSAIESLY